jgi:hypothetical protein
MMTTFEWDYVDRHTKLRVRRWGVVFFASGCVVPLLLLGASNPEPIYYFYAARAVKGTSGDAEKEIEPPDKVEPQHKNPNVDTTPSEMVKAAAATSDAAQPPHRSQTHLTDYQAPSIAPPEAAVANPLDEDTADKDTAEVAKDSKLDDAPVTASHGGLAQDDSEVDDLPVGSLDIKAGVNAPHYRLSLQECLYLAKWHRARFLAWDGEQAVKIGHSLAPRADDLVVLDSSWHQLYATRMPTLLPTDADVIAIRDRVQREFNLGDTTEIKLALPYAYDQEILRAQQEWFATRGLEMDVHTVTEGHFQRYIGNVPSFRVERVFREGQVFQPVASEPHGAPLQP